MRSSVAVILLAACPLGSVFAGSIDSSRDSYADLHTHYVDHPASMDVVPSSWIPVISNGVGVVAEHGGDEPAVRAFPAVTEARSDRYDMRQFTRPGWLLEDGFAPVQPADSISGDHLPAFRGGMDFVPTPGTIALLSVGGLGLMTRRGG